MKPKYTMRQNGKEMADLRLVIPVFREDVELLMRNGFSESAAWAKIKAAYQREASMAIDWQVWCRDPETGEVVFRHCDDVGENRSYEPLV